MYKYFSSLNPFLNLHFTRFYFCPSSTAETDSQNGLQFSKVLWPLGNIYITVSVLLVVAVSTERYLAICRPLQYKPKAVFFIILVLATSMSVNIGRFFEFRTEETAGDDGNATAGLLYSFVPTEIMGDERYIMFSRYWTEIFVTGVLPLVALVFLNHGIYSEIRNSAKFRQKHDRCSAPATLRKTSQLQIRSTVNVNNFDLEASTVQVPILWIFSTPEKFTFFFQKLQTKPLSNICSRVRNSRINGTFKQ
jgi:hypothetical protein